MKTLNVKSFYGWTIIKIKKTWKMLVFILGVTLYENHLKPKSEELKKKKCPIGHIQTASTNSIWIMGCACVWERKGEGEMKARFKQCNTVQQGLMFSTQCSRCALWVTALCRALLAAVYGNRHGARLWRRAPLPAWPLPLTYKNLSEHCLCGAVSGAAPGWHQTWAGRD